MCTTCDELERAGLHAGHLERMKAVSSVNPELLNDVFMALTDHLQPRLPTFAAIIAMLEASDAGDLGLFAEYGVVWMPLSVVGANGTRYRTPTLERLHDSVLPLRMADATIDLLRSALQKHGLDITFLCCCGGSIGPIDDIAAFRSSDLRKRRDHLRSAIDAKGNPVVSVSTLDDIPVATMDLHDNGAEYRLLERISTLLTLLRTAGHPAYDWVDGELAQFINAISTPVRAVA